VIASLLLISLYIGFRFEFKFAVPVLIALFHDLLITAGVYALTDREVTTSTVAALLTIMGYSLYDTVIVFDRIRENVPRMPRATFSQISNRAMSEVLTRSLATSFAVLMPVGSLLIFGGATLKDFAFALLVGVASGAYSSIFIATPVLVEWKERENVYMRRRRLVMQENDGIVPAFATAAVRGARPAADVQPDAESRQAAADSRAKRRAAAAKAAPPAPEPSSPPAPAPARPPAPEPARPPVPAPASPPAPAPARPPAPVPGPTPPDGAEAPSRPPSRTTSTTRTGRAARTAERPAPQADGADRGDGADKSKPKPKPKPRSRPRKKHGRR
jgi:SecD/SecF fusion protein